MLSWWTNVKDVKCIRISVAGVAVVQHAIHKGVRSSTATAYLDPAFSRPNLHVAVNTVVHKVLFVYI